MGKLRIGVVALVLLTLGGLLLWQEHRARGLVVENARLRQQVEQTAIVRDENQRLSARLQDEAQRSEVDLRELVRLRGQAGMLRQQENVRPKRLRPAADAPRDPTEVADSPDYHYTPEQSAFFIERLNFGKNLGLALSNVAEERGGQLPADLAPAAQWLSKNQMAVEGGSPYGVGVDQFELVYAGRLPDLPDPGRIILAQEKDPVEVHEGRWTRMYVFADGHVGRLEATTREGFAAREKEVWPDVSRQ
jgi:prepilin-type processing-associated H-X9-DG protein